MLEELEEFKRDRGMIDGFISVVVVTWCWIWRRRKSAIEKHGEGEVYSYTKKPRNTDCPQRRSHNGVYSANLEGAHCEFPRAVLAGEILKRILSRTGICGVPRVPAKCPRRFFEANRSSVHLVHRARR